MKNMKKIATVLAGLCLAFVMAVTFTACGSGKEFDSIQEYLDAQKDQIDAAIKAQSQQGLTMEVKADGDTLVYRYVYDEAIDMSDADTAAEIKEYFDTNIDTYKSQFDAVITEMKELIDVKSPKVKLLYENPDGSVVYEYTFE